MESGEEEGETYPAREVVGGARADGEDGGGEVEEEENGAGAPVETPAELNPLLPTINNPLLIGGRRELLPQVASRWGLLLDGDYK